MYGRIEYPRLAAGKSSLEAFHWDVLGWGIEMGSVDRGQEGRIEGMKKESIEFSKKKLEKGSSYTRKREGSPT